MPPESFPRRSFGNGPSPVGIEQFFDALTGRSPGDRPRELSHEVHGVGDAELQV